MDNGRGKPRTPFPLSFLPAHDLVFHIFRSKMIIANRCEMSPRKRNIFMVFRVFCGEPWIASQRGRNNLQGGKGGRWRWFVQLQTQNNTRWWEEILYLGFVLFALVCVCVCVKWGCLGWKATKGGGEAAFHTHRWAGFSYSTPGGDARAQQSLGPEGGGETGESIFKASLHVHVYVYDYRRKRATRACDTSKNEASTLFRD